MKLNEKEKLARSKICLPLDGINSLPELKKRVKDLSLVVGMFKIGKESYTRFGEEAICRVHKEGAKVFLDLKYHDIPNTVKGAAKAATELGVYMFNVHAPGGIEMMQAAVDGANQGALNSGVEVPKIVGVTVLTSLDNLRYVQGSLPIITKLSVAQEYLADVDILRKFDFKNAIDLDILISKEKDKERKVELQNKFDKDYSKLFDYALRRLGLENLIPDSVLNKAQMAEQAGLDGIVCSAADLSYVKDKLPEDFMYVTPGIKGLSGVVGTDQKRVFTPGNAIVDGSSVLVVGRAITDPRTVEEKKTDKEITLDMQLKAGYEIIKDMVKVL